MKPIRMNQGLRLSLLAAVVGLVAAPAAAQFQIGGTKAPSPADLVDIQLISFAQTVKPGDTFWVGVTFDIADTWHIYWRHPGDSGEPPRIDWQLPEGWQAGDIHWPVPERFAMAGDLVSIGYKKQATLLVPITVSKTAEVGSSQQISGEVHYLVCDDKQCLAAEPVKIATAVSVGEATGPANEAQLKAAQQLIPRKQNATALQVSADGLTGTLRLADDAAAKAVFVVPDDDYSVQITELKTDGKHRGWRYTVEPLTGVTIKDRKMPAVVVFTDAAGKQQQVQIDLPLNETTR